jgi:hypothetical protein
VAIFIPRAPRDDSNSGDRRLEAEVPQTFGVTSAASNLQQQHAADHAH